MMAFLGAYYGLAKAAFLHGAGHQAPQEFQVASSKHTSDRDRSSNCAS
ncbi:MAG: type IV toxin-antitoxin system AbiEi family antitoxin [Slackia sp.]